MRSNNLQGNIVYCSPYCPNDVYQNICLTAKIHPLISIQKFHRLFIEGLSNCDSVQVNAISILPITPKTNKKIFWKFPCRTVNKVNYFFPEIINVSFCKNVTLLLSVVRCLIKAIKSQKTEPILVCDCLNITASIACLVIAKLFRLSVVGIVTDLPNFTQRAMKSRNAFKSIVSVLFRFMIRFIDGYVFLTQQMAATLNVKGKKYIVIEGLVDSRIAQKTNHFHDKDKMFVIVYAGGLYENNGLKMFVESFLKLDYGDVELHIYGSGPFEQNLVQNYLNKSKKLKYFGFVENDIVVDRQAKATLLVNPRNSRMEFAQYSFPSKNLESMASGTPLATTALPGIPRDHFDYIYLLNDESQEKMVDSLRRIVEKPREELYAFGQRAKQYVLSTKNNLVQSRKLIELFCNPI